MLTLAACGGGNASSDTVASDTLPTQMDSVMKPDSVTEEGKKVINFTSSQQALDFMQKSGHWDQYQSGILPRMAQENLDYCGKLLNNEYEYFIVVDKAVMKVILYSKYGNVVKEYGMACAKNYGTKHKKADSRTPEGFFTAEGIYDSTDWLFTNDAGYTSPARGQFGPRFIRLKTPVSSQIGIHGTAAPGSIGRRCSHGCIRLTNDNILELVKYAKVGMPIIVSPGPKDMAVNKAEGYNIAAITTGATKIEPAELPVTAKSDKKTADKAARPKAAADSVAAVPAGKENTGEEVKAADEKKQDAKPEVKQKEEKPKEAAPEKTTAQ